MADRASDAELKVLAAFARKVNVDVIATTQGVSSDFVDDTVRRWCAGDRTLAKQVVAEQRQLAQTVEPSEVAPVAVALPPPVAGEPAPVPFNGKIGDLIADAMKDPDFASEARELHDRLSTLAVRFCAAKVDFDGRIADARTILAERLKRLDSPQWVAEDARAWAAKAGHPLPKDVDVSLAARLAYLDSVIAGSGGTVRTWSLTQWANETIEKHSQGQDTVDHA